MILIGRVVAQDVHVEAGALLDQRQPDAPGANHGDGLARNLVAEKRQVGMPETPLLFAGEVLGGPHFARQRTQHEEGKLGRGFGQHVGRVRERNLVAIGVGAVDVVKADRDLGHHLQRLLAGFEDFGVNLDRATL